MSDVPTGKLTLHEIKKHFDDGDDTVAVYHQVIMKDESGKLWYYNASCFVFDLKPV